MSSRPDSRFDSLSSAAAPPGSVMAARLSEKPENKVLLIEAGPRDWHPMIHMPTGEIFMVGSKVDWQFKSEPEAQLGGYQVPLPRGPCARVAVLQSMARSIAGAITATTMSGGNSAMQAGIGKAYCPTS